MSSPAPGAGDGRWRGNGAKRNDDIVLALGLAAITPPPGLEERDLEETAEQPFSGISYDMKVLAEIGEAIGNSLAAAAQVSSRAARRAPGASEDGVGEVFRADEADQVFADRLFAASTAAIAGVNGLLAAASASCTIAPPPKAISAVTNSQGNLVLRCGHSSYHEWDSAGRRVK